MLATAGAGQALTGYNSMIGGPRQPGEIDGPEEFHLILLDNHRTQLLADPEQRDSLALHPLWRVPERLPGVPQRSAGTVTGLPMQGPIGSVITPHLRGLQEWKHLSNASSLCGACTSACPVKIDLHHHLLHNRRNAAKEKPVWWEQWAFQRVRGGDGIIPELVSARRQVRALWTALSSAHHEYAAGPRTKLDPHPRQRRRIAARILQRLLARPPAVGGRAGATRQFPMSDREKILGPHQGMPCALPAPRPGAHGGAALDQREDASRHDIPGLHRMASASRQAISRRAPSYSRGTRTGFAGGVSSFAETRPNCPPGFQQLAE